MTFKTLLKINTLPLLLFLASCAAKHHSIPQPITWQNNPAEETLTAALNGRTAFIYQYGEEWDLPHFYPLNTPRGQNLLVQRTEPYPHHRSFWFADTVERNGVEASFYNAYYSGVERDDGIFEAPFATRIRHVNFTRVNANKDFAIYTEELVWETTKDSTPFPMLNEYRTVKVYPMPGGSYLMDMTFALTADYGDVKFVSDEVHYAWPYLRIHPDLRKELAGTITSDTGATGQEDTNMQPARWIDYSHQLRGISEGIAVFQFPGGKPHRWLTREYGTFGPRRPDAYSGKPFTLAKGDSISQRVAIYVHTGDVTSGKVSDVYEQYVKGQLP